MKGERSHSLIFQKQPSKYNTANLNGDICTAANILHTFVSNQNEKEKQPKKTKTEIKMEDLLHSAQMLISTQIPADQTRVTS